MKVLIIGAGFLGQHIAVQLHSKGIFVTCATTKRAKLPLLEKMCNKAFVLQNANSKEFCHLLEENDVLIVSVSTSQLERFEETFLETALAIKKAAKEQNQPKHLLFSSCISVYGDHKGHWVDEQASVVKKNKELTYLVEAEQKCLSLQEMGWKVSILRFAELYGPTKTLKMKMQSLQNKVLAGDGHIFSNMVHIEDAVDSVEYILQHNLEGIYNIVDDEHPVKQTFYEELCDKYHLQRLIWDPHLESKTRVNLRASNHKIKSTGYPFKHPIRQC